MLWLVAGIIGFALGVIVGYTCCVMLGRCSRWEEDALALALLDEIAENEQRAREMTAEGLRRDG